MAAEAVRACLGTAGVTADVVDMLCTGTSGGDAAMPGFANMVQGELAAPPMTTSSHTGVCAAGLAALAHAAMTLDARRASCAVVAASDVPSRLFKRSRFASRGYDIDFDAHFLRWMLSDAAGAWLLESSPRGALSLKLLGVHLRSFSGDYPVCMQVGLAADSRQSYLDYESFAAAEADGAYALRQDIRLLPNLFDLGIHEYVRLVRSGWLDPRHFHIGSEILDFIARNVPGTHVPLNPLRPVSLRDLRDHLFVKHDLNLFSFVINLNRELRAQRREVTRPPALVFDGISKGAFGIEPMPDTWHNVMDLQTAIELFTPIYQLFLTDNDFWRATNSLQLDETIAIYVARILEQPHNLVLLNNKHPLVPESTLRAGHRLVLHGLASEMLYELLVRAKRSHQHATPPSP
jgi:hypothetical protein